MDYDDILDAIPALYTTPAGAIVDAETGTVLSDQDAGSLLTTTLETYRRATIEAQALRLQREDQVRARADEHPLACAIDERPTLGLGRR